MSDDGQRRLGSVLRVRDVLERRALGRLADGHRRVAAAEAHLRGRAEAYQQGGGARAGTTAELWAIRLAGLGAHEALRSAEEALEVAAHRRDELTAEWSQATAERKSAERLADRRAQEARAAAERAEARELDEMVSQRRARA